MGRSIAEPTTILRVQKKALAALLPDTSIWYGPNNRVVDVETGAYKEYQGVPLTYNGSINIPCRVDVARFFRSGTASDQELTINDFEMHVPYDFTPQADHRILYKNEFFEVRKLMDTYSNPVTKLVLITRLETIEKPLEIAP